MRGLWLLLKLGCVGLATLLLTALTLSEWTENFTVASFGFGGILVLFALFILFDAKENKTKKRIAGENRP